MLRGGAADSFDVGLEVGNGSGGVASEKFKRSLT